MNTTHGGMCSQLPAPPATLCPFRWQTKYFDNETGLYYFGCRFFESLTGRWLTRDPIAENGGVNLYAFCNNDPVNGVDGLGLWGIQFGDFQIGVGDMWMEFRANAEMAEALHGGVSIVTSTLTFGLSDKVKLTDSSQYQGGAFTVSRVGATVGREALITAATLGLSTAARGGSVIAQTAYKGLLVTEAATGGYQAGQGINAVREGDTVNGAIDIFAGSLRVGGSILSASQFTKLAKSTASGTASKIHITEAVSQDVQNGVARPVGSVKAVNRSSGVGAGAAAPKNAPDFIVSQGGTVYPVPKGASGPIPVRSGKGIQFIGGSGGNGLSPKVTDVRIMDPITNGKYQYPSGYGSYGNVTGQTVHPFSGQTISKYDPWWHIKAK